MAIKTPSILPELQVFVKSIPHDTPYDRLLPLAGEAGYTYSLQQTAAEGCADGTVLVTFQVLVGKADAEKLEPYEVVSVKVGNAPGPVSLAARMMIVPTIVYLFFGRLPPPVPMQQPEPERTIDMSQANGHDDIVLDNAPAPPEADDRDFPVVPEFVPPRREPEPRLNLIARREPDGVPIFIDLYAMDGELAGIDGLQIAKVLVEDMETFIKRAESAEQVLAIYEKNPDVTPFLKDFGTPELNASLLAVSKRKSAQLSTPPVTVATANAQPRQRRVPVGARG